MIAILLAASLDAGIGLCVESDPLCSKALVSIAISQDIGPATIKWQHISQPADGFSGLGYNYFLIEKRFSFGKKEGCR